MHNEVRDFDKNLTKPEIRVNRVRDNESQLYMKFSISGQENGDLLIQVTA
jgi:hypothetical protein